MPVWEWLRRNPLRHTRIRLSHLRAECPGRADAPFSFVEGVERAVHVAKQAAGEKAVVVASPNIAQQCLNAGLLDEVAISLIPVLLGSGIPFFANLERAPLVLDGPQITEGSGVTHLRLAINNNNNQ
jgi:dihydrofolate reductase